MRGNAVAGSPQMRGQGLAAGHPREGLQEDFPTEAVFKKDHSTSLSTQEVTSAIFSASLNSS